MLFLAVASVAVPLPGAAGSQGPATTGQSCPLLQVSLCAAGKVVVRGRGWDGARAWVEGGGVGEGWEQSQEEDRLAAAVPAESEPLA